MHAVVIEKGSKCTLVLQVESEKHAYPAAHSGPCYPFPTICGPCGALVGSLAPQVGLEEGSVGVDWPPRSTGHYSDLCPVPV